MNEPGAPALAHDGSIPPSIGLDAVRDAVNLPRAAQTMDARVLLICILSIVLALFTGLIAEGLMRLIAFVTNLSFYGRVSTQAVSPAGNTLGLAVILIPVIGGLIVGLMARYGSKAIRGHGIPEAMEQVLLNESRIPARVALFKPLSAAISIGTGGPFGAEGPIIATGGAFGSLIGQFIPVSSTERKTLLAAGAAAGMAATFGSPVSAVLLAIELLLFEFRPRSVIPVALASAVATGVRHAFVGSAPPFPMPQLASVSDAALTAYILLGALIGIGSVIVTRLVYAVEDAFEKLPIHWMWWPAIGGLAVGIVGVFAPRTMGVGYDNIEGIVAGKFAIATLALLGFMKLVSWSISLGSGTSGGTLAPLFTIGGAGGALIGYGMASLFPGAGIDPRICGLVGMAAMFAGASRALLASVVFAFETTLQPMGLLPLLGGCTASFLVSSVLMRNTIMTEKLARRGVRVPSEYAADHLDQLLVRDYCARDVVTLKASDTVDETRSWLISRNTQTAHQGFPVLDDAGHVVGVLTRRNLLDPANEGSLHLGSLITRKPALVLAEHSLREAADHMVHEGVGRLVVIDDDKQQNIVGIITRSDLLRAHETRLKAQSR